MSLDWQIIRAHLRKAVRFVPFAAIVCVVAAEWQNVQEAFRKHSLLSVAVAALAAWFAFLAFGPAARKFTREADNVDRLKRRKRKQ